MVVVEFSYEQMRRLIDLPREKMIASLSEMGAPSEWEPEVKKIITELTPNRPDWYSMEGLARALRSYYGKKSPQYNTKKSDYAVIVDKSVVAVRPYTVCAVVKGLEFDDERIKDMVLLQEKLLATLGRKVKKFGLGIYPLQVIKFPVHYTTMKPGEIRYVPLGYDREMSADEILDNHKKGQQYGHLIKGQGRYPVFTDSEGRIMSLIPIVNSAETGKVDLDTKNVFIEVSGTDLNACKAALNIFVCTFADMGGDVYEVRMEYHSGKFISPNLKNTSMKLDIDKVNQILGTKLNEKKISELLAKMGYEYKKNVVSIPPYRADVFGIVDVIEDIAIAYGYNNFLPTLPNFFNPGDSVKKYDALDKTMLGMGFLETKTFILTNKEKLSSIGYHGRVVEIANPGTVDFTVVRPSLILNILETLMVNKMKGLPQKFYEIGLVVDNDVPSTRLAFASVDKKLEFSEARGYLQTIGAELGLDLSLMKGDVPSLNSEYSCYVILGGKNIGIFGRLNEKLREKFSLEFDVYICELEV